MRSMDVFIAKATTSEVDYSKLHICQHVAFIRKTKTIWNLYMNGYPCIR